LCIYQKGDIINYPRFKSAVSIIAILSIDDLLALNAEDPKAEGRVLKAEVLLEVLPNAAM
jgi:hypothetical protein